MAARSRAARERVAPSLTRRSGQAEREDETSAPSSQRRGMHGLARLQRTLGNRAVARLVQDKGQATMSRSEALLLSLAPRGVGVPVADATVQRREQPLEPEPRESAVNYDEISSPLPVHLRRIAIGLIERGQELQRPDIVRTGRDFLTTGQLQVVTLVARAMEQPEFMGRSVDRMRRGERVTVLDASSGWYLVLTPGGKTGWVSWSRLFEKIGHIMWTGETGSGTSRGEAEIAGRA